MKVMCYVVGLLLLKNPSQSAETSNNINDLRSNRESLFINRGYPNFMDMPLLNRKIFKGTRVSIIEHPYVVSIRRQYVHYLTGSLITNNVVITTAQHLLGVSTAELAVVFGENYSDRGTILLTVVLVVVHERFDPYTLEADVALLRLFEDVIFRFSVKPIFPLVSQVKDGDMAFVTGWGRCDILGRELCLPRSSSFYPDETLDPMLKTVSFDVKFPNYYCEGYKEHGLKIYEGLLCLGLAREEEPACSCMAVSGAPLVVNATLAGLQSWGLGCGYAHDLPLMYTSIYYYRSWLVQNLKVMMNITSFQLKPILLATKSYVMTRLMLKTRLNHPKRERYEHAQIQPLEIDKKIAKLSGNVYDIRDFIARNMFNYVKRLMYERLRAEDHSNKGVDTKLKLNDRIAPFLNEFVLEFEAELKNINASDMTNIKSEVNTKDVEGNVEYEDNDVE